ncbi:hypothetical protein A0H81_03714 [Grifola frondosa]|uniref:Uncharacterized protein n=1 Tax=Grifola frondosa TaxID=5627 RepID=A0A1C7MKE3_GRIFR|nr:hypothetical protein A0H81_03714 [Grifola frondosa]
MRMGTISSPILSMRPSLEDSASPLLWPKDKNPDLSQYIERVAVFCKSANEKDSSKLKLFIDMNAYLLQHRI